MKEKGVLMETGTSGKLRNWSSHSLYFSVNIGRFIMLSVITNIYNKKTKGPTLTELFTVTHASTC